MVGVADLDADAQLVGALLVSAAGVARRAGRRRERMTREELEAEARQQQIASLDDVRFAVLETNGKISFVTK